MSAVARNILPDESEAVPRVMDLVLLTSAQTSHPAVRLAAFKLVGELGEWVQRHPHYLERILNWILTGREGFLCSESVFM